jgi:hypothetical protein
MTISDNPLDLLEERCKNLVAMLPDTEVRPALDALLQQMVIVARMAGVIRQVADMAEPIPEHVRATLREFGDHADASIRRSLAIVEAEAAKHNE